MFTGIGIMVLGGFVIYFFIDFSSNYSNSNISPVFLVGIRSAIIFFSLVIGIGIAQLLGWFLILRSASNLP
jgi:hypothetical protein